MPAFDSAKYGCGISGLQGTKLILGCGRSVQDTLGWTVVFDPDKVDTAAGCVGGGAAGCVVAAASTWATAPARWCVHHTTFVSGKTDTVWIAGKFFSPNNPPQLDDGPYTSTIVSGALTATPAIAAGTGVCPAGSAGCSQVTVDGEPCDSSPAAGEATGSSVCPKNPAWVYLQDAKVGDVFTIDGEYVVLVAKNGNQWTLQRGYGLSSPSDHSSTTLTAHCMARDFSHGVSNWSWTWDTARDPHGLNSDGTTVRVAWDYDHPVPRPDVTIGGMPSYDGNCQSGGGECYAVRDGTGSMGDPPNRYVSLAPAFSGATGTASFIERAQDHPSWLQDNAASSERQWFTDGRPLQPLMDISDAAISVSGQLYRLTSTTTDGDNLHRVGYNIYVVKTSPTTVVAAGNCSAANPCPIWNDTNLQDSITQPCTITLLGGSGTVYISRISSGGLGATYTNGLAISADNCPLSAGTGFPGGSTPLWAWGASSGTWAASGSDNRGGSSGYFGNINRKIQPTWAYCGMQPLIDASSAATGDVLSDTAADSYKYCVARKPGECRTAAQPGDIYVNCPNEVKRNGGSYGCMWYSQNQDIPVDICVGNMSAYLNSIVQVGFKKNDFTGALGRTLTKGLTRYKMIDPYWHGKALSDASWVMFRSMYTNGAWTDILLGKLPPFPPTDSVVRSTFQPIPVKLTPPAGLAVDNAVIQFGYAENGGPGQFYCTSRQEKCLATAATVPAVPFLFPSEGAGGVEAGVSGVPLYILHQFSLLAAAAKTGGLKGPRGATRAALKGGFSTTEFQPARTLPAELRARRRAQFQNELHHQLFDGVPNLAVFRIFHEHRIGHFPIHNPPLEFLRQEEAGHIDHQVEIRPPQMPQTFRKMIPQIDILLVHRADGIRSHRRRRRQACAGRNHHVAAVRPREALRHLAAAGIADTDEQHALLARPES